MSGDPLEKFYDDLNEFVNIDLGNLPQKKPQNIKIGGIINNINQRYDKKNRPWAIIELHGQRGKSDIFVFNEVYEKTKNYLQDEACVFIKGKPSDRDEDSDTLKMIASDLFPLEEARARLSKIINILLEYNQTGKPLINQLQSLTADNKGQRALVLHLKSKSGQVQQIKSKNTYVSATPEFINKLRNIFGKKNVWIS